MAFCSSTNATATKTDAAIHVNDEEEIKEDDVENDEWSKNSHHPIMMHDGEVKVEEGDTEYPIVLCLILIIR